VAGAAAAVETATCTKLYLFVVYLAVAVMLQCLRLPELVHGINAVSIAGQI
jgi:hypothetical protein